jgi:hypothetical protein
MVFGNAYRELLVPQRTANTLQEVVRRSASKRARLREPHPRFHDPVLPALSRMSRRIPAISRSFRTIARSVDPRRADGTGLESIRSTS